ncbi:MAG: protein-L-isoaspartate(D-aspartate) O-methyltransferase [Thermodesulfobacteriota bacterium]
MKRGHVKPIAIFFLIVLLVFSASSAITAENGTFQAAREEMVSQQLKARGIEDPEVLAAMKSVHRHAFVPESLRNRAYADSPLPIGEGQTISQPYIVAMMTATLDLDRADKVLEVGTGSGYQAAVLARIVDEVYSIEIKEKLHEKASRTLKSRGYTDIHTRHGDGYFGWAKAAPFDAIMITAAVDHIPPPLLKQLKDGGKLILPLGNPFSYQNLVLVTKRDDDYTLKQITGVLFVPMTGRALEKGEE